MFFILTSCSGSDALSGEGGPCLTNRDCDDGQCIAGACIAIGSGAQEACAMGAHCPSVEGGDASAYQPPGSDADANPGPGTGDLDGGNVVYDARPDQAGSPTDGGTNAADGGPSPDDGSSPIKTDGGTSTEDCNANPSSCPEGQVCSVVSGACIPEGTCGADADCAPPATVCGEQGVCIPGCGAGGAGAEVCVGDELCDTLTGHCVLVRGPCQHDSECDPPKTVCEVGQCVPGCAETGGVQCPGGQLCEPTSGRCVVNGAVCASDDDCATPAEVCDLLGQVCTPGCSTTGCEADRTCDPATGYCVSNAPCTEDAFEPNNSASASVGPGPGVHTNLAACPGNEDFFHVDLVAGDDLTVGIRFLQGDGDLDAELLGPTGTVVASSNSATDNESIHYSATTDGRYTVRIFLKRDLGPNKGNKYALELSIDSATCREDAYEPSSLEQPSAVVPGTISDLNVCPLNADYYQIYVQGGQTLDVEVLFTHGEGDIDLTLYHFYGLLEEHSWSATDNEYVSFTASYGQIVDIEILLYEDLGSRIGNTYTLRTQLTP
ncbi:MAG: PPC domain-containing protein [Deltaproteobacteria bacterium]|nr:PPC domain-containing protein [Deltaproteobacteria bacterium]